MSSSTLRRLALAICVAGVANLASVARVAHAQTAGSAPLLITPTQLDSLRAQRELVVLQVGSPAQFTSGHVPGARPVALSDVSTPRVAGALTLELPDTPALEQWARSVGITNHSRIVVVPGTDTLQSATRVFLTLAFMGFADRTSLLNGGVRAWKDAGKPLDTGEAAAIAATTGPLRIVRDSSIVAVMADVDVATRESSTAIVDARLPQFYAGQGGGYPRPGHIPTAVNVPLSLVSENGLFKSNEELRALFAHAGVKPGDSVITYCHIGQQATLLWFVARQLGYNARMYDGSFQEWSGSDKPLALPPA